jgi:hypothetical protein
VTVAQAGDVLGDFVLVREAGRGAMGVVYEATQRSLSRRVAVKVLAPSAAGDPVWVERFRAEATAAAKLSHPGILPVHAVGTEGDVPWFAMEFVEGKTAAEIVEADGPLDPREAARMVRDAALALDHAHGRGIVHRDVKPGNLMRRADGRVVVADFGLAKHVGSGSLTATGSIVGTPYYMAPELASGLEGKPGASVDVYGLGATLYELLTGGPPFTAESPVVLLRQIVEREPTPPSRLRPDVPRDLETIVLGALEKRPAARYASCKALADDLDRFLRDEPVSRRRPGAIERARRLVRRNPVSSAVVLGAVVLLVVGAFLFQVLLAEKEAEIDARVEKALAESREALERGDLDAAEEAVERVASSPTASAAQKARARAAVTDLLRKRRAGKPAGPAGVEEALAQSRGNLPAEWLTAELAPATVSVAVDAPGARVEATPVLYAKGDPVVFDEPSELLPLGAWRVTASAPGRATARVALVLFEPGGRLDLELALPKEGDVPAGMAFLGGEVGRAGSPDGASYAAELPPFFLDRTEVMVADYARFLASLADPADRAAMTPESWERGRPPPDSAALPVVGVTWEMADRYAASVGKRLPTREELEFGAFEAIPFRRARRSAPDLSAFRGRAVTQGSDASGPRPVDRPDAHEAPTGVRDLLGNVAEWSASTAPDDVWHVQVLGGSWREALGPQAATRLPGEASETVGFRCARSAPRPARGASPAPARPLPPSARRVEVTADGLAVERDATGTPRALGDDVRLVRQGTRFDLEAPADAGLEVTLPAGTFVSRPGHGRAAIGRADGPVVVAIEPVAGQRIKLEVVVPGASAPDAGVREAVAAATTLRGALFRLDAEATAASLDDAFFGSVLGDKPHARSVVAGLAQRYERIEEASTPWGADRTGPDRVVVRRVVTSRRLRPRGGGDPESTGRFPEIDEIVMRRDAASGRWLCVKQTNFAIDAVRGRLRPDGTWACEDCGFAVKAPFGALVRQAPKFLADAAWSLALSGELTGEILVYRRVDTTSGIPPLSADDHKRFGHEVLRQTEATHRGKTGSEVVTDIVENGIHRVTRRWTVRRGEGAVVLLASATGKTPRQAGEALREGKARVEAFYDAVVLDDAPGGR